MLKNKFFTILLMFILLSPVYAEIEDDIQSSPLVSAEQNTVESSDDFQEELSDISEIQYKQPISRKKIAKKFLLAMGGVGVSSLLLFVGLSFYNKVRENIIAASKELSPSKEASLQTPDSLTESVKTFLEKTKWE